MRQSQGNTGAVEAQESEKRVTIISSVAYAYLWVRLFRLGVYVVVHQHVRNAR